jgi:ankyrin repeat protein
MHACIHCAAAMSQNRISSDKWGGLSIPSPATCHVESYCPKLSCESGSTALHVACANGNQEAVALLLAHGARTDLANEYVVLIAVTLVVAHELDAQCGHDVTDGGLSPRPRGRCFGPACHCTGWDQSAAGQHGAYTTANLAITAKPHNPHELALIARGVWMSRVSQHCTTLSVAVWANPGGVANTEIC